MDKNYFHPETLNRISRCCPVIARFLFLAGLVLSAAGAHAQTWDFSLSWQAAPPDFVTVDEPFSARAVVGKPGVSGLEQNETLRGLTWKIKSIKFVRLAGPKKEKPDSRIFVENEAPAERPVEAAFTTAILSAGKYECRITAEAVALIRLERRRVFYYRLKKTASLSSIVNVEPYKVCFKFHTGGRGSAVSESAGSILLEVKRNAAFGALRGELKPLSDAEAYYEKTEEILAIPGVNYEIRDAAVRFEKGETTWSTEVMIINNAIPEPDKKIVVNLPNDVSRFINVPEKHFADKIEFNESVSEKSKRKRALRCRVFP